MEGSGMGAVLLVFSMVGLAVAIVVGWKAIYDSTQDSKSREDDTITMV